LGSYAISPLEWPGFLWPVMLLTAITSVFILVMAWKRGRLFCNAICPVGTLLGLISRLSLFRLSIRDSACTHCGACVRSCKAQCIQPKTLEVDVSRCILCFNCLNACSQDAFHWEKPGLFPAVSNNFSNEGRRKFFRQASLVLLSAPVISTISSHPRLSRPTTPPGSFSRKHFSARCTACHLCVAACPTKVLQPSFLEYGLSGMLQPKMDFRASFCNYECVLCTQVCPTGALLPLTQIQKKATQLARVKFDKELCIVITKGTACGACSEHCPTKAVSMVAYSGKLSLPQLEPSICVGCGACEFACPVDPRAIWLEALEVHRTALPPQKEEKLKKETPLEEFPF
jgi:ferredoxin-type protein NapF